MKRKKVLSNVNLIIIIKIFLQRSRLRLWLRDMINKTLMHCHVTTWSVMVLVDWELTWLKVEPHKKKYCYVIEWEWEKYKGRNQLFELHDFYRLYTLSIRWKSVESLCKLFEMKKTNLFYLFVDNETKSEMSNIINYFKSDGRYTPWCWDIWTISIFLQNERFWQQI